ncbi:MAG TPA: site-specific integrase [Polyangiaceae bacterium]|jgi:site-specific recombinase XerD
MKRLRDKMREDLVLRGMAENTITIYRGAARRFVEHFNRPLSGLGEPEIRSFLLHLVKRGAHPRTVNSYVSALRVLYRVTLERPEGVARIPYMRKPMSCRRC